MSKKHLYALILIALTVVVILFNGQGASVRFLPHQEFKMAASFAYLIFAVVGVVIGVLLH